MTSAFAPDSLIEASLTAAAPAAKEALAQALPRLASQAGRRPLHELLGFVWLHDGETSVEVLARAELPIEGPPVPHERDALVVILVGPTPVEIHYATLRRAGDELVIVEGS